MTFDSEQSKFDAGKLGAKHETMNPEEDNPARDLMLRLVKKYPEDRDTAERVFKEYVQRESETYGPAMADYYFQNHWKNFTKKPAKRWTEAGVRAVTKRIIAKYAHDIFAMPIGDKNLGNCTGIDLVVLGGFVVKLVNKVGPRQRVRDALTREEVLSLLQ